MALEMRKQCEKCESEIAATGEAVWVAGFDQSSKAGVLVRIDPTSRLNVHMDTDEANACGLHLTKEIELIK